MARRATGAWLILLGAAMFAGTFVGAFAPTAISRCHHPLCHDGHHGWRSGRTVTAKPLRLSPLAVSKKEKEIKAEERRRVDELAALKRKVCHASSSVAALLAFTQPHQPPVTGKRKNTTPPQAERVELQRGLEDAMAAGDGLAARNLLRETARGDNPDHAEDPDLVSIAIRTCSEGGRHADVLELYDVLSGGGGATSTAGGEFSALALIASAATDQWQRADQLLATLLQEVPRRWADDDLLRTSALTTAAQSGKQSGAVAMILEGVVPTSDEGRLIPTLPLPFSSPSPPLLLLSPPLPSLARPHRHSSTLTLKRLWRWRHILKRRNPCRLSPFTRRRPSQRSSGRKPMHWRSTRCWR